MHDAKHFQLQQDMTISLARTSGPFHTVLRLRLTDNGGFCHMT